MKPLVAAMLALSFPAHAVVFSGTSGNLAASATFTVSGDDLTITLANIAGAHPGMDTPGTTLSGLFFDIQGNPTLTPFSAMASGLAGAPCDQAGCAGNLNLGGEFGFQTGLNGSGYAIASSGYLSTGLPGNLGNFNGPDLDNPASVNGINYGIVSALTPYNPNGGLAGEPVVLGSATFVLHGATGLTDSSFSGIVFQYGTALTEAHFPGTQCVDCTPTPRSVPEPGTMALIGIGFLASLMAARRRV